MDEMKREVKAGDRVTSPKYGEGTVLWTPEEKDCYLPLICVRFDNPSEFLHDGNYANFEDDQGDPENANHCWWFIEGDFENGELAYVE